MVVIRTDQNKNFPAPPEIWAVGAESWRNPDEDLPADFERRRRENYGELRKPLDPSVFTNDLRGEMSAAFEELDSGAPELEWLEITDRASGAITLSTAARTATSDSTSLEVMWLR